MCRSAGGQWVEQYFVNHVFQGFSLLDHPDLLSPPNHEARGQSSSSIQDRYSSSSHDSPPLGDPWKDQPQTGAAFGDLNEHHRLLAFQYLILIGEETVADPRHPPSSPTGWSGVLSEAYNSALRTLFQQRKKSENNQNAARKQPQREKRRETEPWTHRAMGTSGRGDSKCPRPDVPTAGSDVPQNPLGCGHIGPWALVFSQLGLVSSSGGSVHFSTRENSTGKNDDQDINDDDGNDDDKTVTVIMMEVVAGCSLISDGGDRSPDEFYLELYKH
ncbi:hypothetical protein ACOMHN_036672 [Nucella lapillus]